MKKRTLLQNQTFEKTYSLPIFSKKKRRVPFMSEKETWDEMKKQISTHYAIGLCIAAAFVVLSVRAYLSNKSRSNTHGSVADLVKRGQLRSDRRGISKTLKYDDPFNNPMVKVSKSKSTVEMCGKVYRLAPVTLTEREQSSHQKRRSRAYQWKRPTMFLKEGDSIPPDVDPDTVRWIPANHPFATTVNDIDEDVAQSNVYQKNGVPFRIKAEHEALQKKLEALQNGQKLNKLGIDPGIARQFEKPFKSFSSEQTDKRPSPSSPKIDNNADSSENKTSDELQKP
ncbi:sister chromatid cohesion protein 1 [Ranunculus cassubicifolius]